MENMIYEPSEALLIYDADRRLIWTHPDIDSICTFSEESPYAEDAVQQLIFTGEGSSSPLITVIAKSPAVEQHWKDLSNLHEVEPAKTKAITADILLEFEVMFIEDVWMPGAEQFCFTPIGEKVGDIFKDVRSAQFFPCALWRSGTSYGFDARRSTLK